MMKIDAWSISDAVKKETCLSCNAVPAFLTEHFFRDQAKILILVTFVLLKQESNNNKFALIESRNPCQF
jgi:hypothetical protein